MVDSDREISRLIKPNGEPAEDDHFFFMSPPKRSMSPEGIGLLPKITKIKSEPVSVIRAKELTKPKDPKIIIH